MPLTRGVKETVQARIRRDRKYRKELLREGVESLLAGDLDIGKAILRDLYQRHDRVGGTEPRYETADKKSDADVRP